MRKLNSKHFQIGEFSCHCGCGFDDIYAPLVELLDNIRDLLGLPIKITSGCRCIKHNKEVGGKPESAHLKGLAVDIAVPDSHYCYLLLPLLFTKFKRIGLHRDFIHVDMDNTKPQEVAFPY